MYGFSGTEFWSAWISTCLPSFYKKPALRRSFAAEHEEFCPQVGRSVPGFSAWLSG
jgi:hypothetical protein